MFIFKKIFINNIKKSGQDPKRHVQNKSGPI